LVCSRFCTHNHELNAHTIMNKMHILFSYVYVLACTVLILNFVTVQCINSNGSVTWTILSNISKIFSKKTGACAHRYFPRKETTGKIFCASTNEATNAWLSNQIHKKPKHLTPDCKYISVWNNKHRTQSKLIRTFSQIYFSWNCIFHTTNVPRQESQFHLATLQM